MHTQLSLYYFDQSLAFIYPTGLASEYFFDRFSLKTGISTQTTQKQHLNN